MSSLNEEWQEIVDLATKMIQVIKDHQLVREGYVNWDEVVDYMNLYYTASFTEEMFSEAIQLIMEATEKMSYMDDPRDNFKDETIPPGTTIH